MITQRQILYDLFLAFFVTFSVHLAIEVSGMQHEPPTPSEYRTIHNYRTEHTTSGPINFLLGKSDIRDKRAGLISTNNDSQTKTICKVNRPPVGSAISWALWKQKVRECSRSSELEQSYNRVLSEGVEGQHNHEHSRDQGAIIGSKIGALIFMTATALAGCIVPLCLRKTKTFVRSITYINSFACGTYLGLAFFHLLPESLYITESAQLGFSIAHNWYSLLFPLSFVGFILILIFEKVLLVGVEKEDVVGHNHGHDGHCTLKVSENGNPIHPLDESLEKELQSGVSDIVVAASDADPSFKSTTTVRHFSAVTLLATLSLSVHSVFEGIVVGTFDEALSIWVASLSICGHKWAGGFALAASCLNANMSPQATWIHLFIFIFSSPLGILIGIGVSATSYAFIGVIDAISLGAILYTGCELLFSEFGLSKRMGQEIIKLTCLMAGALMVFGLYIAHLAGGNHQHQHKEGLNQ